jgi:hypothetical protein
LSPVGAPELAEDVWAGPVPGDVVVPPGEDGVGRGLGLRNKPGVSGCVSKTARSADAQRICMMGAMKTELEEPSK